MGDEEETWSILVPQTDATEKIIEETIPQSSLDMDGATITILSNNNNMLPVTGYQRRRVYVYIILLLLSTVTRRGPSARLSTHSYCVT